MQTSRVDPSPRATRPGLAVVQSPPRRLFRARRVSRRSFDSYVSKALKAIRRRRHLDRKREAEIRRECARSYVYPADLEREVRLACPSLFLRPRQAAVAAAVMAVREQF
jgi:hypothetical protein